MASRTPVRQIGPLRAAEPLHKLRELLRRRGLPHGKPPKEDRAGREQERLERRLIPLDPPAHTARVGSRERRPVGAQEHQRERRAVSKHARRGPDLDRAAARNVRGENSRSNG
jgi:hypothetical protein